MGIQGWIDIFRGGRIAFSADKRNLLAEFK